MTKVLLKEVKCSKCGEISQQFIVCSINYSLGNKADNDKLMERKQKCPNCRYETQDISK